MSGARTSTLATLRGRIERLEAHGDAHDLNKVPLGHAAADTVLRGGLAVSAVHEVFAEGHQSATATGFIAGLSARISPRRPLVWIRQDFSELESGALSMSGLCELGLDPRLLVTVRAADTDAALRTAADALACDALGAVVLEVWGQARQLDLVASRKLTLAAQASGVTALLLRVAAEPRPSTAETRWIVRAAHSPPSQLQCLRRLGAPGARLSSTRNSFATVMARSAVGSWNGNAMSAYSSNRRRILSLWLPRLPIDRIKRKLSSNGQADISHTRGRLPLPLAGEGWGGGLAESRFRGEAPLCRRRQAKQCAADPFPRRSGRALRPLDRPAPRQCPRHLSRVDGVRCRRGRRLQDARRHRGLVRPLHAAGGARSAVRPVSRHHRLCSPVWRRTRAAADRERRAVTARLYRQRRGRLDLDLRPHADAAGVGKNHCRGRGGPGRQPAADLRARRRRCHHRRPAPRRLEDHRRRRLARAPRNHGALRLRLHQFAGAGAGAGRCADQPPEDRCRITSSKSAFPNRSPPKT